MIDQMDVMRVIEKVRGDALAVPTMRGNVAWSQVSNRVARDIPLGGVMGKASSFALGLCLSQPETKVIVFDGDGSLVMNMGTLVTIANKAPKNFSHFLMDNGVYATTGGQDVPGAGTTDFAELARSAGYPHSYRFDDLEDFVTQVDQVFGQEGPVFVWVKTVPNIRPPWERAPTRGAAARRTPQAIPELMEELGVKP